MTKVATFPNQATLGLERIAAFLREERWRAAEELGLTPTQIAILSFLEQRGPQRGQAVARQLGVRQPTASDASEALLRKGFLRKAPDPGDRRAVLFGLTAKGRKTAARLASVPAALAGSLEALPGEDRAALARLLTLLIRSLQEQGAIEPQRLCATCRYFRPNAHNDAAKPHHCAFVDAAFGDADLRHDCGDHDEADDALKRANWTRFSGAAPA